MNETFFLSILANFKNWGSENLGIPFSQPLSLGRKRVLTTGMAHFWTTVVRCKTSFGWTSDKLSHVWVRLFLQKLMIIVWKDRTHADRLSVQQLTTKPNFLTTFMINFYYLNLTIVIWKILKSDKITTFHQNLKKQVVQKLAIFVFKEL